MQLRFSLAHLHARCGGMRIPGAGGTPSQVPANQARGGTSAAAVVDARQCADCSGEPRACLTPAQAPRLGEPLIGLLPAALFRMTRLTAVIADHLQELRGALSVGSS